MKMISRLDHEFRTSVSPQDDMRLTAKLVLTLNGKFEILKLDEKYCPKRIHSP